MCEPFIATARSLPGQTCLILTYNNNGSNQEIAVQPARFYAPLRVFSYVVLALMGAAVLYAFGIALTYWSGIGV